ncbi:MAG: hypothetical protein WBE90_08220, partial [Xanthobacteraceae bacterium]
TPERRASFSAYTATLHHGFIGEKPKNPRSFVPAAPFLLGSPFLNRIALDEVARKIATDAVSSVA